MKAFLARALLLAWPCVALAQVAVPQAAVLQIAVLQIKVLEGEGTVHAAGARIPHPVTVEVTDESGRPVAGAAVSFQLPPEGPSGLFSNGLRTDLVLTDAAGRAAVHSVQLNRTGGPFRIRITAVKELARAGAISTQYIGESHNATVASAKPAASSTAPAPPQSTPQATPPQAPPQAEQQSTAKSGEITPTTVKMSSGGHKKWYVLAAIVAGGGVAFLGVSRSSSSKSTVSSSVVTLGIPTITIGHP